MPHCPTALISSSSGTTSSASKCRAAPGTDEGAVPRNVQLSKYPAEPRTWCLTALQPLFLRRGAPRPPLQSAGQARERGASLPSSPYFFVEAHHVLRSKMPTGPGDVVPHCPPALVPSSRRTTSSAPKCRVAPETWCLTALQPLFLRRGAPRPPPQNADRHRGRGASSPVNPYSFVTGHHVIRHKVPDSLRDVVPHCPPALISRRGAPRPPLRSAGQPRGCGASFPAIDMLPL